MYPGPPLVDGCPFSPGCPSLGCLQAYLVYGVPKNPPELSVLLRKASYLIGGIRFSAAAIDQNILAPPDAPAFGRVVVSEPPEHCHCCYGSAEQPFEALVNRCRPATVAQLLQAGVAGWS